MNLSPNKLSPQDAGLSPVASYGDVAIAQRNKVLRNTYLLLALTMIPTVLGAWVGVASGIKLFSGGILGMVLFLAVAFGFIFAIEKFKNSAAGIGILLGFTFFLGLVLSSLIARTLAFKNGGELIMLAAGGTGAIFFGMASLAGVIKRDLSKMGQFLFVGVIVLILAGLGAVAFEIPALALTVMVLAVVIFSAFLLYDLHRIINGGETNYISATLAVYLDLFNIFSNLLSLLGIFGGERD
jgi:FtsH-binding integral membrane protein